MLCPKERQIMDEKFRNEMRDYVWKYFALHADQRIKTFNFYLVLCTLITGGLIALVNDSKSPYLAALVAFGLTFISFIFWRLDLRNKELIHHSEEALKLLEDDSRLPNEKNVPHRLKIFSYEECITTGLKGKRFLWAFPCHFRYSTCFNAVFLVLGFAGLVAGGILLFR